MIELKFEDVIRIAGEVVSDFGADHTYDNPGVYEDDYDGPTCSYVHGDKPGCLVGHILHRMGVSLGALAQHEGAPASQLLFFLGDEDVTSQPSSDVVNFLADLQRQQDFGKTWGDSLEYAL